VVVSFIKAKILRALTIDKIGEIVNDSDSDINLVPETNPSESSSENDGEFSESDNS
jgi:hypothetical protein